jgi:cytochrome c biogenesis protein CcdA
MENLTAAIGTAFWLGLLTSISPCPLATNIVSVSYIGKRMTSPRRVLLAGMVFTLGRLIAYVSLAMILVWSLLALPEVALFLQRYMNKALGPLLIIVGLMLLGILRMPSFGMQVGDSLQGRTERFGIWGAGTLGFLFALSFCPVSAALYFGSLIPLATEANQPLLLPSVYGIGTSLPVVLFAYLIATGARSINAVYRRIVVVERWATRITAIIMIGVGIYYIWLYLLK